MAGHGALLGSGWGQTVDASSRTPAQLARRCRAGLRSALQHEANAARHYFSATRRTAFAAFLLPPAN